MTAPLDLLLVEDNEGHARLIEKNLRRADLPANLTIVSDGETALDFIHGRGAYLGISHTRNVIVLLDLNLPGIDGFEVLRRLKSEPVTSRIPVIVLTTTDDDREVERCYQLGCNLYITKPIAYDNFAEAIQKLGSFLSAITIPTGQRA